MPERNSVGDYNLAGYAILGHFGVALGHRVEKVVPGIWGAGWYRRMFPYTRADHSNDHFDPEKVLRAILQTDPARCLPAQDRDDLARALFPGLTQQDIRSLRNHRGRYAHYELSLVTVAESRAHLLDALELLKGVATRSWGDAAFDVQLSEVLLNVRLLEAGRPVPTRLSTPEPALAAVARRNSESESGRAPRAGLRIGDIYPGAKGGAELRILESSDDLWDPSQRLPVSDRFGIDVVGRVVRGMRSVVVSGVVWWDEADGTLAGDVLGQLRYLGSLAPGGAINPAAIGERWQVDALLLPHAYTLDRSGNITVLEDTPTEYVPPDPATISRLRAGFAEGCRQSGLQPDWIDLKVSMSGTVVGDFDGTLRLLGEVVPEDWFPGHFEIRL